MGVYEYPRYPYTPPADLKPGADGRVQRRPLIVVGAGPVGLAAAIDARLHGLDVIVLDEDDTVSVGSRAVCYAKRALEILDRLGVGDPVCARGVSWNVGRTFVGEQEVYSFDLVPQSGHQRPGMINLQQYHLEDMLIARARALGVDIRWKYRVIDIHSQADHARLRVDTPDGPFDIESQWLIAADGARSPIRRALGLDIEGRIFMDRFLIADVILHERPGTAPAPGQPPASSAAAGTASGRDSVRRLGDRPERWLWFDPPFHRGQTVLLHKQSDNVWRIDFQLGWDADPEEERKPERVRPRIQAMLGADQGFDLEWVSIYTFQCRRMKDFRHQRVLFVGDAAHQVSPFGARGANSGFQDTDDLLWKLALVMRGQAPERLLDSYSADRTWAADENLMNSTRSTDFITPKTRTSRHFRNAVLDLARKHPFARKLVNSGRLSVPSVLTRSMLNTADTDTFAGDMVPGAPMDDAPLRLRTPHGTGPDSAKQDGTAADTWLLHQVGQRFVLMLFTPRAADIPASQRAELQQLRQGPIPVDTLIIETAADAQDMLTPPASPGSSCTVIATDREGLAAQRYDARAGTAYLIRPDQHVAARWRAPSLAQIRAALARATGDHPCA